MFDGSERKPRGCDSLVEIGYIPLESATALAGSYQLLLTSIVVSQVKFDEYTEQRSTKDPGGQT